MARPVAQRMFDAIMMDQWPDGMAALVDFGCDGWGGTDRDKCYQALYYPIREGEITLESLDAAMCSGPKLTALVAGCKSNPHKGIVFHTCYDDMSAGDEDE